ncbi:MAG: hypothetical protein ACOX37_03935 [Bacillota bacterium]
MPTRGIGEKNCTLLKLMDWKAAILDRDDETIQVLKDGEKACCQEIALITRPGGNRCRFCCLQGREGTARYEQQRQE